MAALAGRGEYFTPGNWATYQELSDKFVHMIMVWPTGRLKRSFKRARALVTLYAKFGLEELRDPTVMAKDERFEAKMDDEDKVTQTTAIVPVSFKPLHIMYLTSDTSIGKREALMGYAFRPPRLVMHKVSHDENRLIFSRMEGEPSLVRGFDAQKAKYAKGKVFTVIREKAYMIRIGISFYVTLLNSSGEALVDAQQVKMPTELSIQNFHLHDVLPVTDNVAIFYGFDGKGLFQIYVATLGVRVKEGFTIDHVEQCERNENHVAGAVKQKNVMVLDKKRWITSCTVQDVRTDEKTGRKRKIWNAYIAVAVRERVGEMPHRIALYEIARIRLGRHGSDGAPFSHAVFDYLSHNKGAHRGATDVHKPRLRPYGEGAVVLGFVGSRVINGKRVAFIVKEKIRDGKTSKVVRGKAREVEVTESTLVL